LLEALVLPSARLAPGYETVLVTKTDGEMLSGVVLERSPDELKLRIGKEDILTLADAEIAETESLPSSMPTMVGKLTPREIRDVVAFLGSLEGEEAR
jgi:putative heme-binding domain-containing protein